MNIPDYREVYRSDNYAHHCHHHCDDRQFQTNYARETYKVVNIADAFNNLRYMVELKSRKVGDDREWKVCVYAFDPKEPRRMNPPIRQVPHGDEYCSNYFEMMDAFNENVKRYSSLIDAELKDFKDIEVYKDKIGYERQKIECCLFCRWCKKIKGEKCRNCKTAGKVEILECINPQNQEKFNYAQQPYCDCLDGMKYGWKKLPWQKDIRVYRRKGADLLPPIYPIVDEFGKCDNFEFCDNPDLVDYIPAITTEDDDIIVITPDGYSEDE